MSVFNILGLAFLEQNLLTLESHGTFEHETIDVVMMITREPLEWYFKQQDHSVGLSFKSNFHFALVGHLIKGFRHPSPQTVNIEIIVNGWEKILENITSGYGYHE